MLAGPEVEFEGLNSPFCVRAIHCMRSRATPRRAAPWIAPPGRKNTATAHFYSFYPRFFASSSVAFRFISHGYVSG
ncbi:Uncharacterised protein [Bordetella pertussis]|nr:Uncharacterised protein [Bordetella pertussis]